MFHFHIVSHQIEDKNVRFPTVCYDEFEVLISSTSQVELSKPHAFFKWSTSLLLIRCAPPLYKDK
jgi:hypothetical protein